MGVCRLSVIPRRGVLALSPAQEMETRSSDVCGGRGQAAPKHEGRPGGLVLGSRQAEKSPSLSPAAQAVLASSGERTEDRVAHLCPWSLQL